MAEIEWTSPATFTIAGIRFVLGEDAIGDIAHHDDALLVWKTAPTVTDLVELLARFEHGNIFELGIFAGGSVALTAELATPRRLVAIDLLPATKVQLPDYIAERGLDDVVHLRFGVDQSDKARLLELADEFEGPLDLVYDDASHAYGPTRSSFEALFPRLRPGGVYLIEDWRSEQGFLGAFRDHPDDEYVAALRQSLAAALDDPDDLRHPLARFLVGHGLGHLIGVARDGDQGQRFDPLLRLVHELVQLRAEQEDVIRSIELRWNWAAIERGSSDLPDGWSLSDHLRDDFDVLTSPQLEAAGGIEPP